MDDYAWEWCTSEKKVTIMRGSGDTHMRHSHVESTLFSSNVHHSHTESLLRAAPGASWRLNRARARVGLLHARAWGPSKQNARARVGSLHARAGEWGGSQGITADFSQQFKIEIEIEPGSP